MLDAPGTDPLHVLAAWHDEATRLAAREPDAMALATVSREGRPSARIVLFKGIADGDLLFASNYSSRKGREIEASPYVALVFFWAELTRQIRVEGQAVCASAAESEAYFRTRPRESQLGAWASLQSECVASRADLELRYREVEARFAAREVERPPGWGLYRVTPTAIEFWIARPHRLHDRFRYEKSDANWNVSRLYP
jgi:pyridoxamine 5'-phosphate oxidase